MRDLVALLLKPPTLAASGLLATAATVGLRRRRHRRWNPTLISMFAAFLAGTSFPYGIVLLAYPFVDPAPDLSSVSYYVALAGIALLWAGTIGIKQAIAQADEAQNGANGDGSRSP